MSLRTFLGFALAAGFVAGLGAAESGAAPQAPLQPPQLAGVAPQALDQIAALLGEKGTRSAVDRKLDSHLVYELKQARGLAVAPGVPALATHIVYEADNRVVVDVRVAEVSDQLRQQLSALGVDILYANAAAGAIRLQATLEQIESLAALPQVIFVRPKQEPIVSTFGGRAPGRAVAGHDRAGATDDRRSRARAAIAAALGARLSHGSSATGRQQVVANMAPVDSEGDATHLAALARSEYTVSGAGIKIGVLSDGVDSLATLQAAGELPPMVTVLSEQAGSGDEGTAMLQIVHDLAPGAQLYFATADGGIANFASNIRALGAAGCNIIVDDVFYTQETPFQDGQASSVVSNTNGGVAIQAVKDVTASGALYFSSAGNSGNLDAGWSGTWEGDFVSGGSTTFPESGCPSGCQIHSFGSQTHDTLTGVGFDINLYWSDPLGASNNDYDLFLLDSAGMNIQAASTNVQNGTQDPYEDLGQVGSPGDQIVIVKYSGAGRFLHLDTNRGFLSIATSGEIHGHAATSAPNSFGVAATPAGANSYGGSGPYPNPFNSRNAVEPYSSDGPRRIFYENDGTPITPGNVGSTGGQVLNKPDFTAADCVSTNVTEEAGLSPFCGTSAAAPHAAAIAALVMSVTGSPTASQASAALFNSAVDIQSPGFDRDSGAGIVMANTAVVWVMGPTAPTINVQPASQTIAQNTTASMSVTASGTPPLSYQWYVGASGTTANPIMGATASTYTTPLLTSAASYWVLVSNSINHVDSSTATVTIAFPPAITTQPASQTVMAGKNPQFMVAASGTPPLTYQWQVSTNGGLTWSNLSNTPPFSGATTATLTVSSATAALNGTQYRCVATNSVGSATSSAALLRVVTNIAAGDFDGDARTDPALYFPSIGQWWILYSSTGYSTNSGGVSWGGGDAIPVPGDYDGDGETDPALYFPSTGQWWILYSSTHYATNSGPVSWGGGDATPVPGDYDGDGRTDPALYFPSTGQWWILYSSTHYATNSGPVSWGGGDAVPVPGDYDGDGKTDPALYFPSTGQWWILYSSTGYSTNSGPVSWGGGGATPVPGDYDGDGRTDPALYFPSTGQWWILYSSTGYSTNSGPVSWGGGEVTPVPGDYDGDGKTDPALYFPSTGQWWILYSSTHYATNSGPVSWGGNGATPINER